MSDASTPTFPAWAHDDRWAWLLHDDRPLQTSTRKYLNEGHFENFWLLDSSLRAFTVNEAQLIGRAGLYGWRPGFKGIYVKIRLRFRPQQIAFAEAKDHIGTFIGKNPSLYMSSGLSIAERIRAVKSASSAPALFSALE
jgi:hypothetical protein